MTDDEHDMVARAAESFSFPDMVMLYWEQKQRVLTLERFLSNVGFDPDDI